MSTLNSYQVAQHFSWFSLKISKDRGFSASLSNLLYCFTAFIVNFSFFLIIYKIPLLAICTSVLLMPCTAVKNQAPFFFFYNLPICTSRLPVGLLEVVFSPSCISQLFLQGKGSSPWAPWWPFAWLFQVYQCLLSMQDWRARGGGPSMAWQVPGKREGSLPSTSWLQCCWYSVGCCWWLLLSLLSPRPFLQSRLAQAISLQPVLVHGLASPQGQDLAFVHVEFHEVPARPLWMGALLSSVLTAACGGHHLLLWWDALCFLLGYLTG